MSETVPASKVNAVQCVLPALHWFNPLVWLAFFRVHFKTAEEMRALFAEVPGACDATLEIAERCNVNAK